MIAATLVFSIGCPQPEDPATVDPNAPPPPLPRPDCSAYVFDGQEWDCTRLDRCDNDADNLTFRNACCDCDPRDCLPDTTCPGDPG